MDPFRFFTLTGVFGKVAGPGFNAEYGINARTYFDSINKGREGTVRV
jgi:hypothetical protein